MEMDVIYSSGTSVEFQRTTRRCVFKEIVIFITTALRTSNPTELYVYISALKVVRNMSGMLNIKCVR
jgi:hypothetical protein